MNTFTKEERLCSKKLLEKLFHSGSSFLLYPFRIVWLEAILAEPVPVQVVISVPKRKFKRAVDRNLIKRRIREIYRLNKAVQLYPFVQERQVQLLLAINYVGKDIGTYAFMEKKLQASLVQLQNAYLKEHAE